jgi:hypothetical protein
MSDAAERPRAYNDAMGSIDAAPIQPLFDPPPTGAPDLAVAGRFVDAITGRDFDTAAAALTDDVALRAVLPRRIRHLSGRAEVRDILDLWFAEAELWQPMDAEVDEIAGRMHLRWRIRVTKPSLGPGPHVVEQHAYADAGPDGRLANIALVCTGFLPADPR